MNIFFVVLAVRPDDSFGDVIETFETYEAAEQWIGQYGTEFATYTIDKRFRKAA